MKLNEIIKRALNLIKRNDIVEAMEKNSLDEEQNEVVKLLLFCVNSVEDELARHYFPLKFSESVTADEGVIAFSKLAKTPSRIISVESDGERIKFDLFPTHITLKCKSVKIEYEYVPSVKGSYDSESIYSGTCVGESVIAAGALAEYYIICGEISLSEYWESKYRQLIEGASKIYDFPRYIPARRWV